MGVFISICGASSNFQFKFIQTTPDNFMASLYKKKQEEVKSVLPVLCFVGQASIVLLVQYENPVRFCSHS